MGRLQKNFQLTFTYILYIYIYIYIYINNLPDDVICNIAIYADDFTLYTKHDQASASIPCSDCSVLYGVNPN